MWEGLLVPVGSCGGRAQQGSHVGLKAGGLSALAWDQALLRLRTYSWYRTFHLSLIWPPKGQRKRLSKLGESVYVCVRVYVGKSFPVS